MPGRILPQRSDNVDQAIGAIRFDETLYRMLGANVLGVTRERQLILDPDTYFRRSTRSARLPGLLIDDVTFTS